MVVHAGKGSLKHCFQYQGFFDVMFHSCVAFIPQIFRMPEPKRSTIESIIEVARAGILKGSCDLVLPRAPHVRGFVLVVFLAAGVASKLLDPYTLKLREWICT